MYIKRSGDVDTENVAAGESTTRQILIGPSVAPNFAMRKFKIAPGGGMPEHRNKVEHEQYILNGSARVGIADQVFEVRKDDVIFIPAGVYHWYENNGGEDFVFICVVPNKDDEIQLRK